MVISIIIISLLLIGLILLVVEVIFIPGITVVGFVGVGFSLTGILIAFRDLGTEAGFWILTITTIATLVLLFFAFKTKVWARFSLKGTISGRVNEGMANGLTIGDEGVTHSTLRPVGKAQFNHKLFEVRTFGNYVSENQRVKIVELKDSQITVEII